MNNSKKIIITLFSLFMTVIGNPLFANSDAEAPSQKGNSNSGVIRFISNTNGSTERDAYQALIDKFEAENDGITVEYEAFAADSYYSVRDVRYASGDIDLFVVTDPLKSKATLWGPSAKAGRFLDLSGESYIDNFPRSVLEAFGSLGGDELYTIPLAGFNFVVYYNKDIFNGLGLSIPQTWEEYLNACDMISTADIIPVGLGIKEGWPVILTLQNIVANTIGVDTLKHLDSVDFKEELVEVFTIFSDLLPHFSTGAIGQSYGTGLMEFVTGEAAMTIDGTWQTKQIIDSEPDFEVGAFALPAVQTAETQVLSSFKADAMLMALDNENSELTKKFLSFITQPENMKSWAEMVGASPVMKGVEISSDSNLIKDIATVQEHSAPVWESLLPMKRMDLSILDAGTMMMTGEIKDPVKAADWVIKKFNASKPEWEQF